MNSIHQFVYNRPDLFLLTTIDQVCKFGVGVDHDISVIFFVGSGSVSSYTGSYIRSLDQLTGLRDT